MSRTRKRRRSARVKKKTPRKILRIEQCCVQEFKEHVSTLSAKTDNDTVLIKSYFDGCQINIESETRSPEPYVSKQDATRVVILPKRPALQSSADIMQRTSVFEEVLHNPLLLTTKYAIRDVALIQRILSTRGSLLQYFQTPFVVRRTGFGNELYSPHQFKFIVMSALRQDPSALQFASDEIKQDAAVAIEIVRSNGLCIKYVSEALKRKPTLAFLAMRNNYLSYYLIDARLQDTIFFNLYMQYLSPVKTSWNSNQRYIVWNFTLYHHDLEHIFDDVSVIKRIFLETKHYLCRHPSVPVPIALDIIFRTLLICVFERYFTKRIGLMNITRPYHDPMKHIELVNEPSLEEDAGKPENNIRPFHLPQVVSCIV